MKKGDIVNWRGNKYKIVDIWRNPMISNNIDGYAKLEDIEDKKKIMWINLYPLIKEK